MGDWEVEVDLDAVQALVESDEFVQFILSKFSNIGEPAFILQSMNKVIQEARNE